MARRVGREAYCGGLEIMMVKKRRSWWKTKITRKSLYRRVPLVRIQYPSPAKMIWDRWRLLIKNSIPISQYLLFYTLECIKMPKKINWNRTVKKMRATCANYVSDDHCRNCPNCAHYKKLEITDETWKKIEEKIDSFANDFKEELNGIREIMNLQKEDRKSVV